MHIFTPFLNLLSLVVLVFISLLSPGPDFAITVKNSMIYSRRSGLLTALGIAVGILIHVSYTLLGLGLLIENNPFLLHLIQIIGACYLFYLGYKNLRSKSHIQKLAGQHAQQDLTRMKAFSIFFVRSLVIC